MSKGKLEGIGRQLDDYGAEILSLTINGLGYAIIGILYELNKDIFWGKIHSHELGLYLLIAVFFGSLIIGLRIIKKRKSLSIIGQEKEELGKKVQQLENDIDVLLAQQSDFFKVLLSNLFYKLELNANERISIYKHEKDKFIILGRYSSNPELKKIRRKFYDESEGFINKAWTSETGELEITELPDYEDDKRGYYKNICDVHPISREVFSDIRMKSRCYYLKAITGHNNIDRIAVVVFESLVPDCFDNQQVNDILEAEERMIITFVSNMKSMHSGSDMAQKMGY